MKEDESGKTYLTFAMILSMVIWGISWPSNGVLAKFGSAIDLGFFRYAFVVLSLLPLLLVMRTPLKIAKAGIPFILIAGVLMAIYNYTFLAGLQNGSPGAGGILVTTLNPVMAYGIGMLVDWKKPSLNEALGLGVGLTAGLVLLRIWENASIFDKPGNVLFLLSAFLWSVLSKFTSKAGKYGSPFAFSWWMYLVTLLTLVPFYNYGKIGKLFQSTDHLFWGNLLFASVITTTLATTMYFFATAKIGAEKASSFIFIVPFTAAISAYSFLDEQLEIHTIIGGMLGIVAVLLINRPAKKSKES